MITCRNRPLRKPRPHVITRAVSYPKMNEKIQIERSDIPSEWRLIVKGRIMPVTPELKSNLLRCVDQHSDHEKCWNWKAGKFSSGYGCISMYGTSLRAHRLSYLLHWGTIPPEALVLHRCDNPSCINPFHLWLGTHTDNQRDAWKKGRKKALQIAKHGTQMVRVVRTLYFEHHHRQRDIAQLFELTPCYVSNIINRVTWKNLE